MALDQIDDIAQVSEYTESDNFSWAVQWSRFMARRLGLHQHVHIALQDTLAQLALALEQGDSAIYLDTIPHELEPFTGIPTGQGVVTRPFVWDAPYFYLQRYWALEYRLSQIICGLLRDPVEQIDTTPYQALFHDNVEQQQALNVGVNQHLAIITGGPGTGKTYLVTRIVAVLKKANPKLRIAMAAPTGKAAQRMAEALQRAFADPALQEAGLGHADFQQQQTQTLHRLLGLGHRHGPRYHAKHPLPYDVIVVDEASMLDLQLAYLLCAALTPQARLILLGDAQQLSSVEVGQVLADLLSVNALTHVRLKQSRRFAAEAQIGRFAKFVYDHSYTADQVLDNWFEIVRPTLVTPQDEHIFTLHFQDELSLPKTTSSSRSIERDQAQKTSVDQVNFMTLTPYTQSNDIALVYRHLAQGYSDYINALKEYELGRITLADLATQFDRYRVLVAIRTGKWGLNTINAAISDWVGQQLQQARQEEWFVGRAVMMTINDPFLGLANGDIGICVRMPSTDPEQHHPLGVYFPSLGYCIATTRLPRSVETAFALTIHKSQGSEYRHVAVIINQDAQRLLSQELLYTALTRAKKMLTLYADESALAQSLTCATTRHSGLTQQIQRALTVTSH